MDKKTVGTSNGMFQVELVKAFSVEPLRDINIFKLDFSQKGDHNREKICFEADSLPNARLTDFLGYSPYIPHIKFIVSSKVKKTLCDNFDLDNDVLSFLKCKIDDVDDYYYLLSVKMIDYDDIIFERCSFYMNDLEYLNSRALNVRSKNDYLRALTDFPLLLCKKVCVKSSFLHQDFILTRVSTKLFISQKVRDLLNSYQFSNQEIDVKQDLIFDQ